MAKIINLLNISDAQQAQFCAAASGVEQVFSMRESMLSYRAPPRG